MSHSSPYMSLFAPVLLLAALGCGTDKDKKASPDGTLADAGAHASDASDDTSPDGASSDSASSDTSHSDAGSNKACTGGPSADLYICVDKDRYVADLKFVAKARPTGSAHHAAVRTMLAKRLADLGYVVTQQKAGAGINVLGELAGSGKPDEVVVIGGHYDSVPGCAGADDNGTAVAGALEAARVLAKTTPVRTLIIAFWDEEERGLVGSRAHVHALAAAGRKVVTVFDFEMIGYVDKAPYTQQVPPGMDVVFPEIGKVVVANKSAGDFIALIADDASTPAVDLFQATAKKIGLSAPRMILGPDFQVASSMANLRRSDHASFWQRGYPAIMVTDTSEFRNKHYHCDEGEDAVSHLDHGFATQVVQATVAATVGLLDGTVGTAKPELKHACDVAAQDCGAGKKCTVQANGVRLEPVCVDVPSNPVKAFETCKRPTNKTGYDNCDVGLFCAFWGVPKTTPTSRHCMPLCGLSSSCDKGRFCANIGVVSYGMTMNAVGVGVCARECTPFGDECAKGTRCVSNFISTDDLRERLTCAFEGNLESGDSCSPWSINRCGAGLVCEFPADGASGAACRQWCDATHSCPGGQTCADDIYLGGLVKASVCN